MDPGEENQKCIERCGSDRAVFGNETGVCYCPYTVDCNPTCEKNRPKCSVRRLVEGTLTITYKDGIGNSTTFNVTEELGVKDHDHDKHDCEFLFFDSERPVYGFVPKNLDEVSSAFQQSPQPSARRRRRAVGDNSTSAPQADNAIANPTLCLTYGQALTFKIEINPQNRTLSHYPRYRKNHLLNRNDAFNFGNFRQLHSLVRDSNKTLDFFVHVFTQNGTFVFYDNADPFRETIVNVVARATTCPVGSIQPTTQQVLVTLGVSRQDVSTFC